MMKLFSKRLIVVLISVILLGLWSCADDQREDLAVESPPEPTSRTKSLDDAVYHEGSKTWIVPQKDPYTLANFQKAYDNLASNRSVQKLSRAQTAEFTATPQLEATHYSLKIFPKTEKEQWKIESMEDVKVAYTPFDYIQLPDADVQSLASTRSAANTYPEKSRFTVTYDDMETTEGPAEAVTLTMPVLYAVWPCTKPLPEDMVYEIDYEVFIPNYEAKSRSTTLTTNAMQVLEAEAISLALGTSAPIGPTTKGPAGPTGRGGIIYGFDRFLQKKIPLVNLKQRFQLGSNIWDVYTNSSGYFTIPLAVPSGASYSHLFQHERWKLTWENSTTPFMTTWGTVSGYWGAQTTISMQPGGGLGTYEMHPAVNYYYNGPHSINTWYYETGIRIEAIPAVSVDNYWGAFYYPRSSNAYIKIFETTQSQNNHLAGTILHELGHFTHYGERGGYNGFKGVHDLIKESYASYHGWYITSHYYTGLGYTPSAGDTFTTQDRQSWWKTDGVTQAYYSPLFVDLQDDYNQGAKDSRYNNDKIKDVPYFIIKEVIANCTDWNSVKAKLREKAGPYYSLSDINSFFVPYDNWFANN